MFLVYFESIKNSGYTKIISAKKMYYLWPVVHSFVLSSPLARFLSVHLVLYSKKNRLARQYIASSRSAVRIHGGGAITLNIKSWKCALNKNRMHVDCTHTLITSLILSHTHFQILGKVNVFPLFDSLIFDLKEAQENSMQMIFFYNPMKRAKYSMYVWCWHNLCGTLYISGKYICISDSKRRTHRLNK